MSATPSTDAEPQAHTLTQYLQRYLATKKHRKIRIGSLVASFPSSVAADAGITILSPPEGIGEVSNTG